MIVTAPVAGRIVGDKLRLTRHLARGGMGTVWSARHLPLDCEVAVKFMHPELATNDEARRRFSGEARAAARLRTPHVVQVFDHGEDGGTPYIVMELLEGEDLGVRLLRRRRLGLTIVASLVDQLARGIAGAHAQGIVHRDLKPSNVFLVRGEEGELVKILDFGIATAAGAPRAVAREAPSAVPVLGSPHYMSPEQATGAPLDPRSDLWSLGVLVYRAVTGNLPFIGDTFADLGQAICTADPPPATIVAPHLPPAIDGFFARALAREPAERFQTARELADALLAVAEGPTQPIRLASRSLLDRRGGSRLGNAGRVALVSAGLLALGGLTFLLGASVRPIVEPRAAAQASHAPTPPAPRPGERLNLSAR